MKCLALSHNMITKLIIATKATALLCNLIQNLFGLQWKSVELECLSTLRQTHNTRQPIHSFLSCYYPSTNQSIGEGLPLLKHSVNLSGCWCHFYFSLSSSLLRTEQWKNKYDSFRHHQGQPVSVSWSLPSLRLTLGNWTGSSSLCQRRVLL